MIRNTTTKIAAALLCMLSLLLPCLLCACGDNLMLPRGGYDYRMSSAVDGAILGYPIPRIGENPYCYALPLTKDIPPAAFSYDDDRMEYHPIPVQNLTLTLSGETLSVPYVMTEEGRTFFASASDTVTVYQGDLGDMAVVLSGDTLYLADDTTVLPISDRVSTVWSVHTEKRCLLYSDTDGM